MFVQLNYEMEITKTMLQSKGFYARLLVGTKNTATYIYNRTSVAKINNKSPYEFWMKEKNNISHEDFCMQSIYTYQKYKEESGTQN